MIPQYNGYQAPKQFYINRTYELSGSNEANLFDNISSEFYYMYGSPIYFLPRTTNKEETSFGEYLSATINNGYYLRMWIEELEAWSGNGDMYTKFGLQVTDECTCYINIESFKQATSGLYPKQGDLIYHERSKKLFQISHIENECHPNFYMFGNLTGYKIQCKLFMYNHEKIDQNVNNGIPDAVKALDSLLLDLDNNLVPLEDKEFNQNNKPIITTATPVINTDEVDPLFG